MSTKTMRFPRTRAKLDEPQEAAAGYPAEAGMRS